MDHKKGTPYFRRSLNQEKLEAPYKDTDCSEVLEILTYGTLDPKASRLFSAAEGWMGSAQAKERQHRRPHWRPMFMV